MSMHFLLPTRVCGLKSKPTSLCAQTCLIFRKVPIQSVSLTQSLPPDRLPSLNPPPVPPHPQPHHQESKALKTFIAISHCRNIYMQNQWTCLLEWSRGQLRCCQTGGVSQLCGEGAPVMPIGNTYQSGMNWGKNSILHYRYLEAH